MPVLISLLVFVIVAALIYWIVTLLPLPEPFRTLVLVIVLLILLLYALSFLGVWGTGPLLLRR